MPTSHYAQINKIVEMMFLLRPRSVLDVGMGYGKYGMLAREYLEMWLEYKPYEQRKIKIDGIEAFAQFITPGHRYYYDEIFIGNALDNLPSMGKYDLILLIDVLEHFNEKEGKELLEFCLARGKHIILSTPLVVEEQDAVFGNEFERHRFQWKKKNLKNYPHVTFLPDYYSLMCLIGPEGNRIKKLMFLSGPKFWLRSMFPSLYRFYRKWIKDAFSSSHGKTSGT